MYTANFLKRLASLTLILLLLVSLLPTPSFPKASAAGGVVTITNSYTNVRSGAGSSNALLGKAYKDEKYTYLGTATSPAGLKWYKINFKGKTGYVCSTYASYKASGGTTTTTKKPTTTT
ncbi:MAG: SH3 domain-containing protein, partial [Clostridia bacterium]|nr:SH3 domain-containing protein [Clostridia bacterium]